MDKKTVKDILLSIGLSFKDTGKSLNGKCPICGDSKKNKTKKRGWVLFDKERITFYCFNGGCPASGGISFNKFLKDYYPLKYTEYIKNRDVHSILKLNKKDIKIIEEKQKNELIPINDIFEENSFALYDKNLDKKKLMLQYNAVNYVMERKIPKEFSRRFRVGFQGKFMDRLLIPYYDHSDNIYCFQGRTLTGKEPKYLTHKPNGNIKIFNFYNVDSDKTIYITEGPLDSLFIDNAIATTGICMYGTEQWENIEKKFKHRVWIFDNDKTGNETAIDYAKNGENVFCWGKEFSDVKDINELIVKKNLTKREVCDIVNNNVFSGFKAQMKLKM